MKLIPLAEVSILPNRQRRDFDPLRLNELSESIKTNGLFHPIVLRVEGQGYVLVSGERRMRAVEDIYALGGSFRHDDQEIQPGLIPYVTLGELDPLSAEEAELDENIRRVDLSWQERAAAVARLASLRKRQAEARGDTAPTTAAISAEVRGSSEGVHHETTRRQLIVAGKLDDPEVAKAKTLDEAFKILKNKDQISRNISLAATVGKTYSADLHRAHNEDCIQWLKKCENSQYDVILTDPPYGMGADTFGDSGGQAAGKHHYDDSPDTWQNLMAAFIPETIRVTKAQAHLYMFCDFDGFSLMRLHLSEAGWWVHRTPIIWHKPTASRIPWPEHGPMRKYELCLYAVKGKKPVTKVGYPDVVTYNPDDNRGHQAQKPVALYRDLLIRSCVAGDTVLDPFMGTGTIFAAAQSLKLRATGIERDEGYYGLALKRLAEIKDQPPELAGL